MHPTTKTKQPISRLTPEELDRLTQFFGILIDIDKRLKREQKEAEAVKTRIRAKQRAKP